ncbi:hypothetical protein NMG60_11004515 [Bertholletia excelsa]
MKNKQSEPEEVIEDEHDLEILKAVAQAWHGHSTTSRNATSEFDARRLSFKGRPTRFKLEAMNPKKPQGRESPYGRWDFRQSLWDSYEIVAVSRRLESGLLLDDQLNKLDEPESSRKRKKESKNSLRNLFNRVSSRRFNEAVVPREEGP